MATDYPGTTPQAFYDELRAEIAGDKLGVFVGFDDERTPRAVAVGWLPWSQAAMAPQVILIYSELRSAAIAVGARLREWIAGAGYDRFIGVNLYHDDDAFCRVVRHVGEPQVIGSLVEVRL